MSTSQLAVSVYVAPMRPFAGAPAQVPGDEPMWSPMSSTLIAGATEAILVDTLVTIGQVDALAEWARGFGKRVTGVALGRYLPRQPGNCRTRPVSAAPAR